MSLGQWHSVVAERNKRVGHLKVDQGPVEKKTSPGKAQGLNIHTHMYLGGVPDMDILPKPANISELFEGCIGEVRSLCPERRENFINTVQYLWLKRISAARLGFYQQQEGGSVLQLH